MKLEELKKPKEIEKFRNDLKDYKEVDSREQGWRHTLPQYMEKYGFNLAGSGKYGSVYINPKYQFVIKVFMKDSAYLRWLSFCRKNQDNPFVPKMKGKVLRITDIFYAVRIEKLDEFEWSKIRNVSVNKLFMWALDEFEEGDGPLRMTHNDDIDDVFAHFDKNRELFDLHDGNMMMRNNKQLVVIDPYYNFYNTYIGKHKIDPNEKSDI